jgi:methyltransferase (TIGR00027 family)
VAYYRTLETRRPDAIFRDVYAERLGGGRAEQIARHMRFINFSAWPNITRAFVGDQMIQEEVKRGAEVVLNLAAGLDSRPYRLDLPASLRWIEVDLPDMIAYKQQALAGDKPRCRLEQVALDLADVEARRRLFAQVNESASRVLVNSEGLLVYLKAEAVAELARDLAEQPHFTTWIADIAGPAVLKRMKKQWGKKLEAANAQMHFAPEESTEFFRPYGWKEAEFRNLFFEAERLNRVPKFMHFMMKLSKAITPKARFEKRMKEWKSGVVRLVRA